MRSWMISITLGIAIVSLLPGLPSLSGWPWLVLMMGVALAFRVWLLVALLIGLAVGWMSGLSLQERQLPETFEGVDLMAYGRICSIPAYRETYVTFDFCSSQLLADDQQPVVSGSIKLRLSWYAPYPPELIPNLPIGLKVRLKRLHGNLNPAGFDRETWLFANGYAATGYVRAQLPVDRELSFSISAFNAHLRATMLHGLRQVTTEMAHGPSLEALTLGVTEQIQPHQWDQLARTGTTHLLVISGMHIGWFAAMSHMLLRLIWLRMPMAVVWCRAEIPAGLAAFAGAGLYTGISGAGIPAQRAFLMVSAATLALMVMRRWRASTVFCVALLGVLLVQPLATRFPGFWLSFGAVAAIGLGLAGRFKLRKSRTWQLWRIQWVVTLLLMPFLLFWFAQVSWVSLLVNLVAIPLVTLWVTPAAMIGGLLLVWPDVAALLLRFADLGLTVFWKLLEYAAAPDWAAGNLQVPLWWIPLILVLALFVVLPRGMPGRWLISLIAIVWLFPATHSSSGSDLDFVVLDVGQGSASYFHQGHRVMLYDAGPRYSEAFDGGSAIVLPNLYRTGTRGLDGFIVSHGDSDHAGGFESIVKALPVERLLGGEPERAGQGEPMEQCLAGQSWHWPGVDFEILWPFPPLGTDSNKRSCVLKVNQGPWSILLTGDIDASVERQLVHRYGERLQADILVLAHHGSKHSSSEFFLRTVRPRLALVSAGYRNRFQHPAKDVVARLNKMGIPLFNTAHTGAIEIQFRGNQLILDTERNRRLGYWYRRPEIELPLVLNADEFAP